jgi:hypothetical protein
LVYPLTAATKAYILAPGPSGTANTAHSLRGDGLVPVSYQQFTTLQGFSGTSIKPLAKVDGTVLHTDEPSQVDDLLSQLLVIEPNWFK